MIVKLFGNQLCNQGICFFQKFSKEGNIKHPIISNASIGAKSSLKRNIKEVKNRVMANTFFRVVKRFDRDCFIMLIKKIGRELATFPTQVTGITSRKNEARHTHTGHPTVIFSGINITSIRVERYTAKSSFYMYNT